jgi:hypothetical protein
MKINVLKFLGSLVIFLLLMTSCKKDNYTKLPINVQKSGGPNDSWIVTKSKFNSWFEDGKVSLDGEVKPANSLDFPEDSINDFNKWSQQMFLWITSPKNSTVVLETPEFYTVSPKDSAGHRDLISHPATKSKTALGLRKLESEENQAAHDNNVLMAKDGSLVYYITYVNDVYAQFLQAGQSDSIKYTNSLFPTDKKELDSIIDFAKSKGHTTLSRNTLAMELKTSWVDLANIPPANKSDYITIQAEVPTFDRTSNTKWTTTGEKLKTLALVGMHIVGSVKGHPEMIWATFEHQHNAPNLEYDYIDMHGKTQTNLSDTGNNWLLNSNTSDFTYNISRINYDNSSIIANQDVSNIISPSNTKRVFAFGNDNSLAKENSKIIAFNNSVRNQLMAGDVRKNYIFIGAIWTDGRGPNTNNMAGNTFLANSTMETTFQQNGNNCFTCHKDNRHNTPVTYSLDPNIPNALSHIYSELKGGKLIQ